MFDVTFLGAFLAGLLSFLSPCVLPMVPFYLSYLAGIGINQISTGATISSTVRLRALVSASSFALGVITVFVGLGATATAFGSFVREYFELLRWVAALLIITMGLHFLGVIRIGLLNKQFRNDAAGNASSGYLGAYVVGLAFAFGWSPCVGPVLAAILFTAAGQATATTGALLLFVYGAGLTLPFVFAAVFVGPFMSWMSRFRQHVWAIEKLMGLLLILFGVLIATNSMNSIAQMMLDYLPWLGRLG